MSKAVFQKGCSGGNLDILARQPLWSHGLDYRCGTGHGVSYFGGVHEGPQGFRLTQTVPLQPGMMTTNEPGFMKRVAMEFALKIHYSLLKNVQLNMESFMSLKRSRISQLIQKQSLLRC